MPTLCVRHDLCCGDQLCVTVCPMKNFTIDNGRIVLAPRAEERCLGCGHCVAVCPRDAIELDGIAPESLMEAGFDVTPEAMRRVCLTRRSVRHFAPEPLPRETVLEALEVARQAPSAYNKQPVQWLIVSDREKVQHLAKMTADTLRSTRKKFFVLLADVYDNGRDVMLRDAPQLVLAYGQEGDELLPHDCSAAVSYLELTLHTMGLGTCWTGYLLRAAYRNPAIAAYLGLPAGCNLQAGLMIGRPLLHFYRIPARKPLRVTWID